MFSNGECITEEKYNKAGSVFPKFLFVRNTF